VTTSVQWLFFLKLPSSQWWLIIFFIPFSHFAVNLSLLIYENWHFVCVLCVWIYFPLLQIAVNLSVPLSPISSVVTSTMHFEESEGKCKTHCSRSIFPEHKLFSFFFVFLKRNIMVMYKNLKVHGSSSTPLFKKEEDTFRIIYWQPSKT